MRRGSTGGISGPRQSRADLAVQWLSISRIQVGNLPANLDPIDGYSGRSAFCLGAREDLQIHWRPFADPTHVYDCGIIHARHLERDFARIKPDQYQTRLRCKRSIDSEYGLPGLDASLSP